MTRWASTRAGRRVTLFAVAVTTIWVLVGMGRAAASTDPVSDAADEFELILFHGDGCPHCAAMREFVDDLQDRYPDLEERLSSGAGRVPPTVRADARE